MRTLLLLSLVLVLTTPALAQTQSFTTVDPMTGQVSVGTVTQTPGGGQSYNWVNPYTGETTTGLVSPPIGGTSNFSTFNSQTGQVGVGSIHTTPPSNQPLFLPSPPSFGSSSKTDSNANR